MTGPLGKDNATHALNGSDFVVGIADRYFEDYTPGAVYEYGYAGVSEADIVAFAERFDPQPIHVDTRFAAGGPFGGLIASGWHTAAISMRLFVRTLNFAEGAIGLGVDELRWPNAARPGDVLTVETEILELRASRSRPGHGIIRLRNLTTNQRGEVAQTMLASAMVPRRGEDDKTTDQKTTRPKDDRKTE